jgi:hypothetical protein
MAQGELGISNDEFWTAPEKTRSDLELQARSKDEALLLVDAPAQVDLKARTTLPLVIERLATNAVGAAVPLDQFAIAAVVDLERGEGWSGRAVPPKGRTTAPRVPGGGGTPPPGSTGQMLVCDLRNAIGVPWRPAKLAVWLLLREEVRGPFHVELVEPPASFKNPAVEEAKATKAKEGPRPGLSPLPGKGLVAWAHHSDGPPPPDEPGLRIVAPKLIKPGDDLSCIVRGSFRVKLPAPRFALKPGSEEAAQVHNTLASGPQPAALVPVLAVTTGSEYGQGFTWDWVLPAEKIVEDAALGRFAVDIGKLGNVSSLEQTVFVHLFAGDQHASAAVAFSHEAE